MRGAMIILMSGVLAGPWAGPAVAATRGTPPAISDYASPPQADRPRLAPDGSAVAMLSPLDGRPALLIWRLDGRRTFLPIADGFVPAWLAWKSSRQLVVGVRRTVFRQPDGATLETRLLLVEADGSRSIAVALGNPTPLDNRIIIGSRRSLVPDVQDHLVSLLPDDPDHLLLSATLDADWGQSQVLRIDTRDGWSSRYLKSGHGILRWLADPQGGVRLRLIIEGTAETGRSLQTTIQVRDGEGGDWRPVYRGQADQGRRFIPVAFSARSPNTLFVLDDQAGDRLALREFDVQTLAFGRELASDPHCDIEAIERDNRLIGYVDPCQGEQEHYLDADWRGDQQAVSRALDSADVALLDRGADGRRVLLRVAKTQAAPPEYWILDRSGTKPVLIHFVDGYAASVAAQVAPVREVAFPARDGLRIPALLTMPRQSEDGPLAFVVLPHGGPWDRDGVRFDWIVQFLASRGYGVFQPQFRGSSGYGASFLRAGYRQWGRAMQTDLADAANWLIGTKLADPGRICIVGMSYGGYAALMGVVGDGTPFRCAAAFAPVTDLARLLRDAEGFEWRNVSRGRIIGDDASLAQLSPIVLARQIRRPVLLVHGRGDVTVPVGHSEAMERALRRAGQPVQALYLDEADHALGDQASRQAWLSALDAFLKSNLGAVGG